MSLTVKIDSVNSTSLDVTVESVFQNAMNVMLIMTVVTTLMRVLSMSIVVQV